jgi:3-hydroxyacyl-CoA dehydrogenase
MHFAEPVERARRLEIIRGVETDDKTVAIAVEAGRRMGREVVVIEEAQTSV